MGIEPTRPAWKAGILPLNYTRIWGLTLVIVSLNMIAYLAGLVNPFFPLNLEKCKKTPGVCTPGV